MYSKILTLKGIISATKSMHTTLFKYNLLSDVEITQNYTCG